MILPNETEEEFHKRFKEWERVGSCLFRDNNHRERILDLINDYIDAREALCRRDI